MSTSTFITIPTGTQTATETETETTRAVGPPSATGTVTFTPTPMPTGVIPPRVFAPPPTDYENHCATARGKSLCSTIESCFVYPSGLTCQPYHPYNDAGTTVKPGVPAAWYLFNSYPSVRYSHPVETQLEGANCSTISIAPDNYYASQAQHMIDYDMGGMTTRLDTYYHTTLFHYRGNCAEDYYCLPNNPPKSESVNINAAQVRVPGDLPGTCRRLIPLGGACKASSQCQGWHINSDGSYSGQARCTLSTNEGDINHPAGICKDTGRGSGKIDNKKSGFGFSSETVRTYIMTSMLIFCVAGVYMWYRRRKQRMLMRQMVLGVDANGNEYYYGNHSADPYRRDDNDDGELPSYGQHRRDERVTGPAAEEIGMYNFSSDPSRNTPPPPPPPGSFPATSIRPPPPPQQQQQQPTYPYAMNHPAFSHAASPIPTGPLYPPPQSPPPPLTSGTSSSTTQAEAAVFDAAAVAAATGVDGNSRGAATTPSSDANPTRHIATGGEFLPPAYEDNGNVNKVLSSQEKADHDNNNNNHNSTSLNEKQGGSSTSSPVHPGFETLTTTTTTTTTLPRSNGEGSSASSSRSLAELESSLNEKQECK
ncbi:hypothetical protein BGZ94_004314 [Podila epigama]|nr:hypothetical protein BGZ94_004314 [Podila epigama]